MVRVHGVLRCAKIQNRTRTRITRFGNTAGLPVPVLNPSCGCGGGHCNVGTGVNFQRILKIPPAAWVS